MLLRTYNTRRGGELADYSCTGAYAGRGALFPFGFSMKYASGLKYRILSRVLRTRMSAARKSRVPTVFAWLYSVQGGLAQTTSKCPHEHLSELTVLCTVYSILGTSHHHHFDRSYCTPY